MIENPPKPPVFIHPGAEPDGPADPSEGGTRTVRVLASGRRRLVARLLDGVVVILLMMAPYGLILTVTIMGGAPDRMGDVLLIIMLVVAMLGGLGIWVFLRVARLALWGCTVGHRMTGLRVVRLDGGGKPTWKQAFARWTAVQGNLRSGQAPWDDYFAYRGDARTRQCKHDRKAGTVVVLAEEPAGDRTRRIVYGTLLATAVLAFAAVLGWSESENRNNAWDSPTRSVSFDVDDLYATGGRQEIRNNGRGATFDPVRGRTLDSREGCLAGAVDQRRGDLLSGLGCEGRVEMTYRTTGNVLVTSHVLRFPDTSTALGVLDRLAHTDLKFASGATQVGRVGNQGRYVVVTAGASPDPKLTEDAVVVLQASTLGVIIWS